MTATAMLRTWDWALVIALLWLSDAKLSSVTEFELSLVAHRIFSVISVFCSSKFLLISRRASSMYIPYFSKRCVVDLLKESTSASSWHLFSSTMLISSTIASPINLKKWCSVFLCWLKSRTNWIHGDRNWYVGVSEKLRNGNYLRGYFTSIKSHV